MSESLAPEARLGGHVVVEQLVHLGVERVFSVPGESFLGILDGLHAYQDEVSLTTARHESGAAMMAVGYAKATGRPGVCLVTRGPGATNASIGVHIARQDSVPLIVLVGQIPTYQRDREALQEVQHDRFFREIAKSVYEVAQADRLPEYIYRAWHESLSGRPGPVVVSIPEDVSTALTRANRIQESQVASAEASPRSCKRVADRLREAERPLIVVGGYTWTERALDSLLSLSSRLSVPVCNSVRQQDLMPNSVDGYVGSLGLGTSPHLRHALVEADLVLVVGSRIDAFSNDDYSLFHVAAKDDRLVHVMPEHDSLNVVFAAANTIVSSPEAFMISLAECLRDDPFERPANWLRELRSKYLSQKHAYQAALPGEYVAVLKKHIPADSFMTGGAGGYTSWYQNNWEFNTYPSQIATQSGSMGFGLPAAIGATLGMPDRTACVWAGDGCFLMSSQELATAVRENVDVLVMVVNNSSYGTIAEHQERAFPGASYGTALTNPDFAVLAHAYGIHGEVVRSPDQLDTVLDGWAGVKRPRLIEIRV